MGRRLRRFPWPVRGAGETVFAFFFVPISVCTITAIYIITGFACIERFIHRVYPHSPQVSPQRIPRKIGEIPGKSPVLGPKIPQPAYGLWKSMC